MCVCMHIYVIVYVTTVKLFVLPPCVWRWVLKKNSLYYHWEWPLHSDARGGKKLSCALINVIAWPICFQINHPMYCPSEMPIRHLVIHAWSTTGWGRWTMGDTSSVPSERSRPSLMSLIITQVGVLFFFLSIPVVVVATECGFTSVKYSGRSLCLFFNTSNCLLQWNVTSQVLNTQVGVWVCFVIPVTVCCNEMWLHKC